MGGRRSYGDISVHSCVESDLLGPWSKTAVKFICHAYKYARFRFVNLDDIVEIFMVAK